ncbi:MULTISPECIES: DUF262 domain-containing HNH endonuclease family protein [unclassified Microcystis]|jgi:uncharacterized protein with ParB-like and HNH nuclease domain|uniref:DUF262 domain-containing protein n=1 Tax=unclassified Microcystis TaxID=2643300 RepID=UPI0022BDB4FC|nr:MULTISPECIES: DUF262 domain-containing HNH endonuclease family protein [unclassified Microcystis]MCA2691363.1 DUF262 domain-containing protein [Microcystis sp. M034S2]MCA2751046.1 DUF262 domain-containing protein [Microcystis sp. M144S2]MCZ8199875.1 DUF262 domain-containing HNH endonuclease family protein [Microcystis sp. LE19-55.1A]MCZ8307246.1 DUF262 domain-containing HNH endonuclease family protein [Microcystis sp. LE19-98.1E]
MKASETSLRNLLEGTKQFQIPLFQRPYSWDKSKWETLWEDLMSLYDKEQEPHFLGSIVTQSIPGTAEGISPYVVIDGQQRLTTLAIIIAALRNYLQEKNHTELAEELYEYYLINKFKKDDDFYKILPTQGDREAYKSIIKNQNSREFDNKIIYKAYQYFKERLKKKNFAEGEHKLFKNILLERLILVNITSDSEENPYLIFESLNTKGQELTQADLVRNYVFMKLPSEQREDIYKQKWQPLEASFKRLATTEPIKKEEKYAELLTNSFWFYLRKDGESISQKEVYKEIKKRLDKNAENNSFNIKDKLDELINFAEYYQCLVFPQESENKDELKDRFIRLNRLDFGTCHIFLLNIYKDFQDKHLSIQDFLQIVDCLESYFIRRSFVNKSTRILGKIFENLYKEIKQQSNSNNTLFNLKKVLRNYQGEKSWPSDDEFREGLIKKDIYGKNAKTNDRVKLILETIERRMTKEMVDTDNLTIEHIMPQKLTAHWQDMLGDNHEQIHKTWLHTLGNLTLTADNSGLSNKPFSDKVILFKDSNVSLNKYFSDKNVWNKEEIEKRANYLADLAIEIWSR